MQSLRHNDYDRPTSAYVRRRLAEATLSQDESDGSSWRQLEPGAPAVASLAHGAQSLHNVLLGNALEHVDRYMSRDTHSLAIGDSLEAQIYSDDPWYSQLAATTSQENAGYMAQPSAFHIHQDPPQTTLEVNDMELAEMPLKQSAKQKASITYFAEDLVKSVRDVDLKAVAKRCPLLAMAFEDSRSGPQLFLETLTSRSAEPFVRFLNSGSYAAPSKEWNSAGRYEDVPTSVLLHCEMFRLGDIYDLPEMKSQAYVNVLRQCEFGCSSPDKPIDLCAAIRFLYEFLEKEEQLIDAIVNYCVSCFACHRLAEDVEFKKLAYDLRPFHQALCKNCMERDFANETAAAIIQMPFEPHRPETYASTEHRPFFDDVVFHFHASDEMDSPKKRKRSDLEAVLPIQTTKEPAVEVEVKIEPRSDDNVTERAKRRASSGISTSSSRAIVSKDEDEFEEIGIDSAPEPAAESDSESFEWVNVLPEIVETSSNTQSTLTLRPREQATPLKAEESESDSEWSLV